jgi:16S rRNA (uracil1498-N3)-methyltransferase
MGAPQFFTDPADLDAAGAVLRGAEAHHAAKVLRVQVGEPLIVADGRGRVAEARATAVSPAEVRARVTAMREVAAPVPALTVVVGLLKGGKLDLVVEKLTELGVARVAPAACARSVVRWDARKAAAARDRWAAIALAAAKQAHRPRVPEVATVEPLERQVRAAGAPVVVCWEGSDRPLAAALPAGPPAALTVVIGPEGGLDDAEVAACRAAGAVDASLGGLILRAETAALAATACVGYHYGLLGGAPARA